MIFTQVYPTFNRFYCKVFLTEAVKHFRGAAVRCMNDNTSVVVAHGSGKQAVIAPEMEAFGRRFGFYFAAHEKGDANRSARVEGPFHFIERNFYPGRTFADLADLNEQLIVWCIKDHQRFRRSFQARPIDLFQAERPYLKPLPLHIPEVYHLCQRKVSLDGYVSFETNRYSVPVELIGRPVEVSASLTIVRIFHAHNVAAEHHRHDPGANTRIFSPLHHDHKRWLNTASQRKPLPQEAVLDAASDELQQLAKALRSQFGGRAHRSIKRLYRMYLDYPTESLCKAVCHALSYGLTDLERIEKMTIKTIAGEYFRLPQPLEEDHAEEKSTAEEDHGGNEDPTPNT